MKKIFKKNQIIITALAIMIAIAGYINYKDVANRADKEANGYVNNEIPNNDAEPDDYSMQDPGAAVLTTGMSTSMGNSQFIVNAKLDREQVRAGNKETLLEIINNLNIDDASKQNAISQMIMMTDIAEREAAAELLLEAKGFNDVIVSITDNQADVVVNRENLSDTERAQIEDIIKRKTGIGVENITISAVTENKTQVE